MVISTLNLEQIVFFGDQIGTLAPFTYKQHGRGLGASPGRLYHLNFLSSWLSLEENKPIVHPPPPPPSTPSSSAVRKYIKKQII